jgi:hypothetical protein
LETCEDAVVAWDGSGYVITTGTADPTRSKARDWTGARGNQLLGLMPGEMDDLPVKCGQVSEQIAVASRLDWRLPGGSDAR